MAIGYCDDCGMTAGHDKDCPRWQQASSGNSEILSAEQELAELKKLALASLNARNAEAKALATWENARNNFSSDDWAAKDYQKKALEASKADAELLAAISV